VARAPGVDPVFIGVSPGPAIGWMVRPMENAISIIGAFFNPTIRSRKMQLSRQSAIVPRIRQRLCNQRCRVVPSVVAVATTPDGARITPCQKAAPTRSADRALAMGVRECHPRLNEFVHIRRADVGIAQGTYGVVSLLIGANPQNVGHLCRPSFGRPRLRKLRDHDTG